MTQTNYIYRQLRSEIRACAQKYKQDITPENKPIFNTDSSYQYAYRIADVEEALNRFEQSLPEDAQTIDTDKSMEARISSMAEEVMNFSSSMEARDLARTIKAYFAISSNRLNTPWPKLESTE